MRICGIDPGKVIGWCEYCTDTRTVIRHGEIDSTAADAGDQIRLILGAIRVPLAIERPRAYGIAGNDIADACEQCGWILGVAGGTSVGRDMLHGAWDHSGDIYQLERRAVAHQLRQRFGVSVTGDSAIWKATLADHGGDAAMAGPKRGEQAKWTRGKVGKPATRTKAAVSAVPPELLREATPDRPAGHLAGMGNHARAAFACAWALGQILSEGK